MPVSREILLYYLQNKQPDLESPEKKINNGNHSKFEFTSPESDYIFPIEDSPYEVVGFANHITLRCKN